MNRLRSLRALFASIVAVGSLVVVASAGAAAWQGPVPIGVAGVNAGDSPLVSLDEVLFDDQRTTRGDGVSRGLWD